MTVGGNLALLTSHSQLRVQVIRFANRRVDARAHESGEFDVCNGGRHIILPYCNGGYRKGLLSCLRAFYALRSNHKKKETV